MGQDADPPHSPHKPNRPRRIKGNFADCTHYYDCPRMTGIDICYGKKESLTTPPSASSAPLIEENHER